MQRSRLATTYRRRLKTMIEDGIVVVCGICDEPVVSKATGANRIAKGGKGSVTVDHIIPLSWGGEDELHNMQPAHGLCNQLKGNQIGFKITKGRKRV